MAKNPGDTVRGIIDASLYLVLATADETAGRITGCQPA